MYTDHKALLELLRKGEAHSRIVRSQVRLSAYDLEYIHVPRKENVLADGISWQRCAHEESKKGDVIGEVNEVLVV